MAHSFDRTLLASLGFSDPDKKDRRHDLACQYLAQPHIALKLGKHCGLCCAEAVMKKATPEVSIVKGEGKYRTVIGFADLVLEFLDIYSGVPEIEEGERIPPEREGHRTYYRYSDCEDQIPYRYRLPKQQRWSYSEHCPKEEPITYQEPQSCLVEVKISFVSIGDVLRQVKLYREFLQVGRTVIATSYPYGEIDVETLKAARIYHVRLGSDFDSYCVKRENEAGSTASLEL